MPSKYCCVPKCYNKDDRCYRITTIKGVQEVWIERIGNPDLANLSDVSNASICKKHFHAECIGSDGKLKKFALPTLNLPEYANSPQNDDLFLYSLIEPKPSGSSRKTQVTTLLDEGPELKVQIPRKVYTRKRNVIGNELAGPSRHTQVLELISNEDQIASGSNYIEEIPTFLEGEASISKCHEISLVADEVPGTSRNIRGEITISESDALLLCPDELPSTSRNTRDPEPINWGAKMAQRRKTCTHSAPLKKQLRYFRRKEREAHSKNKTLKSMMRAIKDSKYLENLRKMNKISQNFFMSQVKNQGLKARGRRFTIEDKIFALSLYKQSGKGYRYLSKIFSLPSRRTLLNLLNGIPFDCGINNQIFSSLKNSVDKLEVLDKYCVLMFDEVALSSSLSYNFSKDCMEGLVDLGNGDRRGQLADHALVFMLKSISGQWKQPLCFYFVEYSVKTIDLVKIIKDVVRHVRQAGLTIVATISDQGATNVAAINKLIEATREYSLRNGGENTLQGYIVDNKEIVHLYDPPHLLKGIRNALLTKDLHFRQDGVQKVASWEHIVKTFEIDAAINIYSSIPKLTEEHVLPHKIKKMKVKNAAQIFSRSLYSVMNLLAASCRDRLPTSEKYLDPSASQTASALLFFDGLFDSVNGRSQSAPKDKPLTGVVTAKSPHVKFWTTSLPILESMYFTEKHSQNPIITPSLKHFIFTVKGFLYVWKFLRKEGFKMMVPRCFNQDPLENFFSLVRSHGYRNVNPTCSNFIASFKSLLINNLLSSHSPGSNCEEDAACGALDTLKDFLTKKNGETQPVFRVLPPVFGEWTMRNFDVDSDLGTPYVAGYLAKKIMKDINKCSDCLEVIEAYCSIPANALIEAKQYRNCKMIKPSRTFINFFHCFTKDVLAHLPLLINQFNLKKEIEKKVNTEDIRAMFCTNHQDIANKFINFSLRFILYFYDRGVTKILCGKLSIKFNDPIMKLAAEKYNKRKKKYFST